MIKVILKRHVKPDNYKRMVGLLQDLRAAALHQPGYISGETLVRGRDPVEVLAVGTWLSEQHWRDWSSSRERNELESMVEPLLEGKSEALVYQVPDDNLDW
jgi:heme oxygenase (mycobilin-producing)